MPDAVEGHVTMEWLVRGAVALFRSHTAPFEKPAPIDGACVVHVDSPTACEIKGMVSGGMGKDKMIRGYRTVVRMMAQQGYSGVRLEIFDENGKSHVWIDGKREIA
jgi:hypothetical protein